MPHGENPRVPLANYTTWRLPTQAYDATDRDLTSAVASQLLASGGISPEEVFNRLRPGEMVPPQLMGMTHAYTAIPQPTTVGGVTTPAAPYVPPAGTYATQQTPSNWWDAPAPPPNFPTLPVQFQNQLMGQWYALQPAQRQQIATQAFTHMYGSPTLAQQELAKFNQNWQTFATQSNVNTITPQGWQAPLPAAPRPITPDSPEAIAAMNPVGGVQMPPAAPASAPVGVPASAVTAAPPMDFRQHNYRPRQNEYMDPRRFRPRPEQTRPPHIDARTEMTAPKIQAPTPLVGQDGPIHGYRMPNKRYKPGFALARPSTWGT